MDWDKKTAVDHAALEHFKNRCPVVRTDSYPIPQGLLSESFHEGMVGNVWLRGVDFEFGSSDAQDVDGFGLGNLGEAKLSCFNATK